MSLRLYNVTDGYIDYLHSEHKHVYSNKENQRTHDRKYLGFVIDLETYRYYVPLSSPKASDYAVVEGKKEIRRDSFLIFRIRSGEGENQEIRGTIRFANMIPVPDGELIAYDEEAETDEDYRNLVMEELMYIRKNADRIKSRAKTIYNKYKAGSTEPVMSYCLDYTDLERMHDEWIKAVTNVAEK